MQTQIHYLMKQNEQFLALSKLYVSLSSCSLKKCFLQLVYSNQYANRLYLILKLICSEIVSTLPNTHHHHFFVFLHCCRNQDVNLGIQVCICPIASSHSLPQYSKFPVKQNFYLKARLDTGSWWGDKNTLQKGLEIFEQETIFPSTKPMQILDKFPFGEKSKKK